MEIILNLGSLVLGAIIGWFISWYFNKRSGEELAREAAELRRLANLVLHGLETGGIIELNRDPSGKILGIVITLSANITAPMPKISATATVSNPESELKDQK